MNPNFRNFALWVVIFLLVLALVTLFQNPGHRGGGSEIAYSQLLNDADAGKIQSVVISGPGRSRHLCRRRQLHDLRAERPEPGLEAPGQGRADHRPSAVRQHALVHPAPRELAADPRLHRRLDLPVAPDAVRRRPRHGLRQVEGEAPDRGARARHASTTSPASTRPRRISRRSSSSCATRRSSSASAAASRAACCSSARPAPARP